jgi:serine/threonine-protein kinase
LHAAGEACAFVPNLRAGDVLNGKYQLLRLLAAGGMGTVYEARDVALGQHFAVKILHSEYASCDRAVQRFLREARVMSALSHEHLVGVIDSGAVSGVPYFVMELLRGYDLRHLLGAMYRLPVRRAVNIVLDVCCGLGAAHDAGLIHRDLKPANIFLAMGRNGREVVKVLDFGVAKLRDTTGGTGEGTLIGTLGYMAPEQIISGRDVDHRADIYSLGKVLYEALAGGRLHQGNSASALYRIVSEDPPSLDLKRGDLPSGLAQVVARAMARAPHERYSSVSQLAIDLGRFSIGLPQPHGAVAEPSHLGVAHRPGTHTPPRPSAKDEGCETQDYEAR